MSYSWFDPANDGNDFWTTSNDAAYWSSFGTMQVAITFKATEDLYAITEYKYWYDSANPELVPKGFAVWACDDDPNTGIVVSGSVVTSLPTPTTTGWQTITLPEPLYLVQDKVYRLEFTSTGGFYWGSGYDPFGGEGLVNGPLTVFSDSYGSAPIPTTGSTSPQGVFATVTTTPGVDYPNTGYESGAPAIDITLDIPPGGTLGVLTTSLQNGELQTPYKRTVKGTGGTLPYTFAVTGGALPSGVTLGSDGKFSGIPTGLGRSSFTVQVTDGVSATATADLSILVTNPTFLAARDDFDRGNGSLGSKWTGSAVSGEAGLAIASDGVKGQNGLGRGSLWTDTYYTPDQFSQVIISTVPTSADWIAPAVRISDDSSSCYAALCFPNAGAIILFKRVGGTWGSLTGYTTTITVGDIVRLSVSGSTLTLNYNGVDVATYTDADVTSGQPGIAAFGGSGVVDNWTGGNGPGIVQVSYSSTSGNVDTYSVLSQINNTGDAGRQDMRVLKPNAPNPGYPHAFLWLLPVEPGQGTSYGDSIATIQTLAAQNSYNLTCIQPGYPIDPWYGDNVDDPKTQQVTFMLDLASFAHTDLAVSGDELNFLIGFSKSGFGGQTLFMQHQDVYSGVASWDAAADLQNLTDYGGDDTPCFGEQSALDAAALYDPNLATWKAAGDIGTVNRIWLGAGINLIAQTSDYSDRLTADGIQHTYAYALTDVHNWVTTPGWVAPALAAMIGPPTIPTAQLLLSSGIL